MKRTEETIARISARALALHRSWPKEAQRLHEGRYRLGDGEQSKHVRVLDLCHLVERGLKFLGDIGRRVHRRPAVLKDALRQAGHRAVNEATELRDDIEAAMALVTQDRIKGELKEARRWAKLAPLKAVHRATKVKEEATRKSASALKSHLGECTPQEAADGGCEEWSGIWRATRCDESKDIMDGVDALFALGRRECDMEEILLPSMQPQRLRRAAASFRGDTGLGLDLLRPRHIIYLSDDALLALCRLFGIIEKTRRWPSLQRSVIEVALGKKAGGARLIGLATALYRVWSRVRYADCRSIIEARVDRPFLTAAPGKGAARAALEQAWQAEEAWARGDEAATTMVDLSSFYEHITIAELADGGKRYGLPAAIITLAAHMYTGPRRIRVGQAVSRRTFPRQSILAGCTWATLAVRLIVLPPAEHLLQLIAQRIKGWAVCIKLYILMIWR